MSGKGLIENYLKLVVVMLSFDFMISKDLRGTVVN